MGRHAALRHGRNTFQSPTGRSLGFQTSEAGSLTGKHQGCSGYEARRHTAGTSAADWTQLLSLANIVVAWQPEMPEIGLETMES